MRLDVFIVAAVAIATAAARPVDSEAGLPVSSSASAARPPRRWRWTSRSSAASTR